MNTINLKEIRDKLEDAIGILDREMRSGPTITTPKPRMSCGFCNEYIVDVAYLSLGGGYSVMYCSLQCREKAERDIRFKTSRR